MEGFIIICDFAEVVNGKLYIMGGGWSRLTRQTPVVDMSVAGKILLPWNEANRKHTLTLRLVDDDGQPVSVGNEGQATNVHLTGDLEAGRPPGLPEGTALDIPLAFRFEDLNLNQGRYVWKLSIGDRSIAEATFDILVP